MLGHILRMTEILTAELECLDRARIQSLLEEYFADKVCKIYDTQDIACEALEKEIGLTRSDEQTVIEIIRHQIDYTDELGRNNIVLALSDVSGHHDEWRFLPMATELGCCVNLDCQEIFLLEKYQKCPRCGSDPYCPDGEDIVIMFEKRINALLLREMSKRNNFWPTESVERILEEFDMEDYVEEALLYWINNFVEDPDGEK